MAEENSYSNLEDASLPNTCDERPCSFSRFKVSNDKFRGICESITILHKSVQIMKAMTELLFPYWSSQCKCADILWTTLAKTLVNDKLRFRNEPIINNLCFKALISDFEADWMSTHKPTELSRIKQKIWIQQLILYKSCKHITCTNVSWSNPKRWIWTESSV